jgi:hypothetical protein
MQGRVFFSSDFSEKFIRIRLMAIERNFIENSSKYVRTHFAALEFVTFVLILTSCERFKEPVEDPLPPLEITRKLQDGVDFTCSIEVQQGEEIGSISFRQAGQEVFVPQELLEVISPVVGPSDLVILDRGTDVVAKFRAFCSGAPTTISFVVRDGYVAERHVVAGDDPSPQISRFQAPDMPATIKAIDPLHPSSTRHDP